MSMALPVPLETLFIIMENLPNPSMGEYVRLAHVNHNFKSVFLSDRAWAKFDVCGVRNTDQIYRYKGYELRGIAARFFNYLASSSTSRQAGFLSKRLSFDGRKVTVVDRYSHMHAFTLITPSANRQKRFYNAFLARVPLIALDVWQLWATHPLEPSDALLDGELEELLPTPVLQDKQVILLLLRQGLIDSYSRALDAYAGDDDINIIVVVRSLLGIDGSKCPLSELSQKREFVIEVLDAILAVENLASFENLEYNLHDFLPELDLLSDRDIVLKAVSISGRLLEYVDEDFQADPEIVFAAVEHYPSALEHASEILTSDREFILKFLKNQCPGAARTEREIVLQAVQTEGYNLQWAPIEFRGDRVIVLAAVRQNGSALQYASEELRGDRGVVLEAVRNDSAARALMSASAELRNDRQIVLAIVEKYGYLLRYASEALRADRDIVAAAITSHPYVLQYASAALREDQPGLARACSRNV